MLDDAIDKNPAVAETVLGILDSYETRVDVAKKTLIAQIRNFINDKVQENAGVIFDPSIPIPPGYRTLPEDQINEILESVHELGDETSPIVVMEFLDFQCPYCKRQHDDKVLSELRNVEFPGQVRTAAVMFPLTGKRHELATQAAESAECAFIQ